MKDECSKESCMVHTRTDGIVDFDGDYVCVTYMGELCVATDIARPVSPDAYSFLRSMVFPKWMTAVYRVGDGPISACTPDDTVWKSGAIGTISEAKLIHAQVVDGILLDPTYLDDLIKMQESAEE